MYDLSVERKIDNWSTDILSTYVKEPSDQLYDNGNLVKIVGSDSLENTVILKPDVKKYLLVIASGSWCGPCIKGIPKLRKIHDESGNEIELVSLWNDPDKRTFVNNHRDKKDLIAWPSIWDKYGLMANSLSANFYPMYIFFDLQGKGVERWTKVPENVSNWIKK